MKNMQMDRLFLVSPKIFPHADATSRASGADDVLAAATVCSTLQEAVADCQIIIGASARSRTISWPELDPRQCAGQLAVAAMHDQVAIIFGRENSGLKNHELDICRYLLKIPTNAKFSSLNIAAAVQLVCYELFIAAAQEQKNVVAATDPLATSEQMESFYQHLFQTLTEIGFMHPDKSKSIMRRLRRVYNRTQLDTKELDILRGILRMSLGYNSRNRD
jgi:tRNA (cytidine32/uridine32-2'-O)-methyltransferase